MNTPKIFLFRLILYLETGNFKKLIISKLKDDYEKSEKIGDLDTGKIDELNALTTKININQNPKYDNIEINIKTIKQLNTLNSYTNSLQNHNNSRDSVREIIENPNLKITQLNKAFKQDLKSILCIKESNINLIENQPEYESLKSIYAKGPPEDNSGSPDLNQIIKDRKRLFVQGRLEATNSLCGEATETENSVKTDLKSNQNKYSFTESNITDQKSFYSRVYRDRIFWNKDKMEDVRKRLNLARVRLMELERKDFAEIYELINKNDLSVIEKLKTDHFKKFYTNELLTKNKIQEYLIIQDRTDILVDLIKDDFYIFDYNFCLKYIESLIKNYTYELDLDNSSLKIEND